MFFKSKSVSWRKGGTVDVKAGDTSRTSEDHESLDALKAIATQVVEEHVCDECSGEMKGTYFVAFQERRLFDSEQGKGLFGQAKTKYTLRETVWRLTSWGVEEAKCKSCKQTFLGKAMQAKVAQREDSARAKAEEQARRRQQQAAYAASGGAGANDKIECKACGWRGIRATWGQNNGCPRCRNQEYSADFFQF